MSSTTPVSITRIRIYVSNGAVLHHVERIENTMTLTKTEAEQYRREVAAKYQSEHPEAEVTVLFDTKAEGWVKLK